jgi:hypothetical protein
MTLGILVTVDAHLLLYSLQVGHLKTVIILTGGVMVFGVSLVHQHRRSATGKMHLVW